MFLEEDDLSQWGDAKKEEDQERAVRLNALCRVYEQADRVLSGDPVIVNVVSDGPAPAWSDGASITINAKEINDMDLETLTQVNGLNYHELSHHLYTPRKGTTYVQWVIDNNYFKEFNMLEDQRIETLMVGRYPSIAPYLTATCARWLANTPEDSVGNYLVIRGRRYLPVEIRQAYRDVFVRPDLIPAIIDIVDQYRVLAFPRDYETAKILVKRFHDEITDPLDLPDLGGGPNGCGGRAPVNKGRPEPGKSQERDAKRGAGLGKAEDVYKPKEPTQTHAPKTAAEAISIRQDTVDQTKENGPQAVIGNGHSPSLGGLPENIQDMLNDAIEDVLARKDVQQDIKTKQRVIVGGDGRHDDVTKTGKFDLTTVPQDAIISYRKFAKELQRLRDDSEPAWDKETPTGRLNVQRVIRGCEIDKAFDRWDEGNDGCDIEAVILIDRSGSMSSDHNDRSASIACWTIKRALEHIQAPVTVYAFDDKAEVAYKRTEMAHKTHYKFIYGNGGTHPYPTLLAAEQLLMSSRKKNKILFVITDGQFNENQNDELIERMSKRGILTVMTLIYPDKYADGEDMAKFHHKAEVFGRISNAKDLLPFARSIVTATIKKRARSH